MIQILLATFNGEAFIREQLESLLRQTWHAWQVLVHDDGSTDRTVDILKEYVQRYPDKFVLLDDGILFGNSRDNFAHLLEASTSDYVMFCDQDDVWMPEKIEKTFLEMKRIEGIYGVYTPAVIHSDLEVVDQNLNLIAKSMFAYQGLSPKTQTLKQCLAKNSVTGCTMMLNSAARSVSVPIPKDAMMHDWWIVAKVTQARGRVAWVGEPLIKYRQHGGNAVGAKRNGFVQLIKRILTYAFNHDVRNKVWQQAKAVDPSLSYIGFFVTKVSLSIKSLFK